MLVCSFKVTLENLMICQSNNIMHYIVLQSVQTYVTFNSVTSYKRCLSYHESKFFLVQLVLQVNNQLAVIIMKHN